MFIQTETGTSINEIITGTGINKTKDRQPGLIPVHLNQVRDLLSLHKGQLSQVQDQHNQLRDQHSQAQDPHNPVINYNAITKTETGERIIIRTSRETDRLLQTGVFSQGRHQAEVVV